MDTAAGGPTLLLPENARRASPVTGLGSEGLPTDLVHQATGRLQALALLYAAVFFMAAFFPDLLAARNRAVLVGSAVNWLPGTLAITVALFVAAVIRSPRLSPDVVATVALVFEIASSYGIAAAEFLNAGGLKLHDRSWIGLSWVAVWTLLFTIVVPSTPRRSVFAALAASSGVPVMAVVSFAVFHLPRSRTPINSSLFSSSRNSPAVFAALLFAAK